MKKLLTLLIFLSLASFSFGQNKFFVLNIMVLDSMNNSYTGNVDIHYMNTDSMVNGYKIHNQLTFSGGYYTDTIYYDSNYTANLLTIHHRACGSWTPFFDTSFITSGWLNLTLTAPCNMPCNAGFTYQQLSNGQVIFWANQSINGQVHDWYFGDGHSAGPQDSVSHSYTQNGTYTVIHMVYDSINNCNDSTGQQIVISNITPCDASFSYLHQSNGQMAFMPNNPNGLMHQWYFGDGNSSGSSADTVVNTYTQNGTYTVIHIVYDSANNCYDSTGLQINVSNIKSCDAGFTATQHGSGYVTFVAHDRSNGLAHQWYFGDGNSASPFDSTYNGYTQNGTYTVIHFVYDSISNCYDSSGQQIVISNIAPQCDAGFTATQHTNGYVTFVADDNSSGLIHHWYFGDGNYDTPSDSTANHYPANGTYYVIHIVIDTVNNCSDSTGQQLIINNILPCNANFSATWQANYSWHFTRSDSTSGFPVWHFGDGDSSTAQNPYHTYSSGGYKQVTLKIYDSTGTLKCSSIGYAYMNACGGQNYNYVAGFVLFNGQTVADYDSVRVYLIEYDPTAGILTALDSVDIYNQDTGYFDFDICSYSSDSFLLKAACLPGSKYYNNYLPTYADSSLLWSGARRVANGSHPIYMKSGNNPGGPGFIGGYVSQGANKSGALLDGIEVILLTGLGDPVAYTYTANGGRYEFHNLAYGTYRVRVEIPGLPSEEYVVTLDQQNPLKDDNNFEVNTMGINKPNGIIYLNKEDLKVYPVPATDKLTVEIADMTMDKGTYSITDINGREVSKGKLGEDSGNHTFTIPVGQLGSGYYILNLNSATHSGKISFIKH